LQCPAGAAGIPGFTFAGPQAIKDVTEDLAKFGDHSLSAVADQAGDWVADKIVDAISEVAGVK
jgi:hypothetical protein